MFYSLVVLGVNHSLCKGKRLCVKIYFFVSSLVRVEQGVKILGGESKDIP